MNTIPQTAAPLHGADYDDEPYDAGFNRGYAAAAGDARGYAQFRPAEGPAVASASYGQGAAGEPDSRPFAPGAAFAMDGLDYDPELDDAISVPGLANAEAARPGRGRGLFVAAIVGAVVVVGGVGAFALSFGGGDNAEAPVLVKADDAPIKVKPKNPGGIVVPNQDNKVYDAVAGIKPTAPAQKELVTSTEEPVDLAAEKPRNRVVDLSPGETDAATPAAKSEDRIDQVAQEAEAAANPAVSAVAPRKVRTLVVKPDGTLVPREDPTPAAPLVAASEPTDPAPQHVGDPAAQADATDETSALPPAATAAAAPAAKSSTTPATVAVAPQRPSDQPVDIVGEVKPDQVAAIAPAATAASGSWSMQIASQPTVESAQSTYQNLARRYGDVLTGRGVNIVKAEIAGKGTFYRVRVPTQSRNEAINLCTSYKAAGGNCFVSK